jgi:molybdopterin converting factor small subunit
VQIEDLLAIKVSFEEIDLFRKSIFQFMLEESFGNRIMLSTNYRSHPLIVGLISKLFYDGNLNARGFEDWDDSTLTVRLIDRETSLGSYFEVAQGTSYVNRESTKKVIEIIHEYKRLGVSLDQITVVSPYKAQVQYILSQLRIIFKDSSALPIVTTIDSYQGGENVATIFDLVRSNDKGEMGFVRDLNRINVGSTRGQKRLAFVMDSRVFLRAPRPTDSPQNVKALEIFRKIDEYFKREVLDQKDSSLQTGLILIETVLAIFILLALTLLFPAIFHNLYLKLSSSSMWLSAIIFPVVMTRSPRGPPSQSSMKERYTQFVKGRVHENSQVWFERWQKTLSMDDVLNESRLADILHSARRLFNLNIISKKSIEVDAEIARITYEEIAHFIYQTMTQLPAQGNSVLFYFKELSIMLDTARATILAIEHASRIKAVAAHYHSSQRTWLQVIYSLYRFIQGVSFVAYRSKKTFFRELDHIVDGNNQIEHILSDDKGQFTKENQQALKKDFKRYFDKLLSGEGHEHFSLSRLLFVENLARTIAVISFLFMIFGNYFHLIHFNPLSLEIVPALLTFLSIVLLWFYGLFSFDDKTYRFIKKQNKLIKKRLNKTVPVEMRSNRMTHRQHKLWTEYESTLGAFALTQTTVDVVDMIFVVAGNTGDRKENLLVYFRKHWPQLMTHDLPIVFLENEMEGTAVHNLDVFSYLDPRGQQVTDLKQRYAHLRDRHSSSWRIVVIMADADDYEAIFERHTYLSDLSALDWSVLNGFKTAQTLHSQNRGGLIFWKADRIYIGSVESKGEVTFIGSWAGINDQRKQALSIMYPQRGGSSIIQKFFAKFNIERLADKSQQAEINTMYDPANPLKRQMPVYVGGYVVSIHDIKRWNEFVIFMTELKHHVMTMTSKFLLTGPKLTPLWDRDVIVPAVMTLNGEHPLAFLSARLRQDPNMPAIAYRFYESVYKFIFEHLPSAIEIHRYVPYLHASAFFRSVGHNPQWSRAVEDSEDFRRINELINMGSPRGPPNTLQPSSLFPRSKSLLALMLSLGTIVFLQSGCSTSTNPFQINKDISPPSIASNDAAKGRKIIEQITSHESIERKAGYQLFLESGIVDREICLQIIVAGARQLVSSDASDSSTASDFVAVLRLIHSRHSIDTFPAEIIKSILLIPDYERINFERDLILSNLGELYPESALTAAAEIFREGRLDAELFKTVRQMFQNNLTYLVRFLDEHLIGQNIYFIKRIVEITTVPKSSSTILHELKDLATDAEAYLITQLKGDHYYLGVVLIDGDHLRRDVTLVNYSLAAAVLLQIRVGFISQEEFPGFLQRLIVSSFVKDKYNNFHPIILAGTKMMRGLSVKEFFIILTHELGHHLFCSRMDSSWSTYKPYYNNFSAMSEFIADLFALSFYDYPDVMGLFSRAPYCFGCQIELKDHELNRAISSHDLARITIVKYYQTLELQGIPVDWKIMLDAANQVSFGPYSSFREYSEKVFINYLSLSTGISVPGWMIEQANYPADHMSVLQVPTLARLNAIKNFFINRWVPDNLECHAYDRLRQEGGRISTGLIVFLFFASLTPILYLHVGMWMTWPLIVFSLPIIVLLFGPRGPPASLKQNVKRATYSLGVVSHLLLSLPIFIAGTSFVSFADESKTQIEVLIPYEVVYKFIKKTDPDIKLDVSSHSFYLAFKIDFDRPASLKFFPAPPKETTGSALWKFLQRNEVRRAIIVGIYKVLIDRVSEEYRADLKLRLQGHILGKQPFDIQALAGLVISSIERPQSSAAAYAIDPRAYFALTDPFADHPVSIGNVGNTKIDAVITLRNERGEFQFYDMQAYETYRRNRKEQEEQSIRAPIIGNCFSERLRQIGKLEAWDDEVRRTLPSVHIDGADHEAYQIKELYRISRQRQVHRIQRALLNAGAGVEPEIAEIILNIVTNDRMDKDHQRRLLSRLTSKNVFMNKLGCEVQSLQILKRHKISEWDRIAGISFVEYQMTDRQGRRLYHILLDGRRSDKTLEDLLREDPDAWVGAKTSFKGGQWPVFESLYKSLSERYGWLLGSALAPAVIESGLFVGGISLFLSWQFGLPLKFASPMIEILTAMRCAWLLLHAPDLRRPSLYMVLVLSILTQLIVDVFYNPSGSVFIYLLFLVLVVPHFVVDLYHPRIITQTIFETDGFKVFYAAVFEFVFGRAPPHTFRNISARKINPKVIVYIPSALRTHFQGQSRLEIEATTIDKLIAHFDSHYPGIKDKLVDEDGRLHSSVDILVNGKSIRWLRIFMTRLNEGDEIFIIPAMRGGAAKRNKKDRKGKSAVKSRIIVPSWFKTIRPRELHSEEKALKQFFKGPFADFVTIVDNEQGVEASDERLLVAAQAIGPELHAMMAKLVRFKGSSDKSAIRKLLGQWIEFNEKYLKPRNFYGILDQFEFIRPGYSSSQRIFGTVIYDIKRSGVYRPKIGAPFNILFGHKIFATKFFAEDTAAHSLFGERDVFVDLKAIWNMTGGRWKNVLSTQKEKVSRQELFEMHLLRCAIHEVQHKLLERSAILLGLQNRLHISNEDWQRMPSRDRAMAEHETAGRLAEIVWGGIQPQWTRIVILMAKLSEQLRSENTTDHVRYYSSRFALHALSPMPVKEWPARFSLESKSIGFLLSLMEDKNIISDLMNLSDLSERARNVFMELFPEVEIVDMDPKGHNIPLISGGAPVERKPLGTKTPKPVRVNPRDEETVLDQLAFEVSGMHRELWTLDVAKQPISWDEMRKRLDKIRARLRIKDIPEEHIPTGKWSMILHRQIKKMTPEFMKATEAKDGERLTELNVQARNLLDERMAVQLGVIEIWMARKNVATVMATLVGLHNTIRRKQVELIWQRLRDYQNKNTKSLVVPSWFGEMIEVLGIEGYDIVDRKKGMVTIKQQRFKKFVFEGITVTRREWVEVIYQSLIEAFRSQIHTLDSQYEDFLDVVQHIAQLRHIELLVQSNNLQEAQNYLSEVYLWTKRGFVEGKKEAKDALAEALAAFETRNIDLIFRLVNEAKVKLRESRLIQIQRIRKKVHRRAVSILSEIRQRREWEEKITSLAKDAPKNLNKQEEWLTDIHKLILQAPTKDISKRLQAAAKRIAATKDLIAQEKSNLKIIQRVKTLIEKIRQVESQLKRLITQLESYRNWLKKPYLKTWIDGLITILKQTGSAQLRVSSVEEALLKRPYQRKDGPIIRTIRGLRPKIVQRDQLLLEFFTLDDLKHKTSQDVINALEEETRSRKSLQSAIDQNNELVVQDILSLWKKTDPSGGGPSSNPNSPSKASPARQAFPKDFNQNNPFVWDEFGQRTSIRFAKKHRLPTRISRRKFLGLGIGLAGFLFRARRGFAGNDSLNGESLKVWIAERLRNLTEAGMHFISPYDKSLPTVIFIPGAYKLESDTKLIPDLVGGPLDFQYLANQLYGRYNMAVFTYDFLNPLKNVALFDQALKKIIKDYTIENLQIVAHVSGYLLTVKGALEDGGAYKQSDLIWLLSSPGGVKDATGLSGSTKLKWFASHLAAITDATDPNGECQKEISEEKAIRSLNEKINSLTLFVPQVTTDTARPEKDVTPTGFNNYNRWRQLSRVVNVARNILPENILTEDHSIDRIVKLIYERNFAQNCIVKVLKELKLEAAVEEFIKQAQTANAIEYINGHPYLRVGETINILKQLIPPEMLDKIFVKLDPTTGRGHATLEDTGLKLTAAPSDVLIGSEKRILLGSPSVELVRQKRIVRENRSRLSKVLNQALNCEWEGHQQILSDINGIDLGITKHSGRIMITVRKKFYFEWTVVRKSGIKGKGWKVKILIARIVRGRVNLKVEACKDDERIIQNFIIGPFHAVVSGAFEKKGEKFYCLNIVNIFNEAARKGLSELVTKPVGYDWVANQNNLPQLDGFLLDLKGNGTVQFNPFEKFRYDWFILGRNESGWTALILEGGVKNGFYQLRVKFFNKDKKESFERTFYLLDTEKDLVFVSKGSRPKELRALDFTDSPGRRIMEKLVCVKKESEQEAIIAQADYYRGARIGRADGGGMMFLAPTPSFKYKWKILGFKEAGWEAFIEEIKKEMGQLTVAVLLIKNGFSPIRRKFQIGPYKINIGKFKNKDQRKEFYRISHRMGIIAIRKLITKPRNISWDEYLQSFPDIVGLFLSPTYLHGRIAFSVGPDILFSWSVLGTAGAGWQPRIIAFGIVNGLCRLILEYTKIGEDIFYRSFQIGPFRKMVPGKRKSKKKSVYVLNIFDLQRLNEILEGREPRKRTWYEKEGVIIHDSTYDPFKLVAQRKFYDVLKDALLKLTEKERQIAFEIMENEDENFICAQYDCSMDDLNRVRRFLQMEMERFRSEGG